MCVADTAVRPLRCRALAWPLLHIRSSQTLKGIGAAGEVPLRDNLTAPLCLGEPTEATAPGRGPHEWTSLCVPVVQMVLLIHIPLVSSRRPVTPTRQRPPSSGQTHTFLQPTASSSQRRPSLGGDDSSLGSGARGGGGGEGRRAGTPTRERPSQHVSSSDRRSSTPRRGEVSGAGRHPSPQRGWKY